MASSRPVRTLSRGALEPGAQAAAPRPPLGARLAGLGPRHRRPSESILLSQGEPQPFVYVVGAGTVKLYRVAPGGSEIVLDLCGPGAVLGVFDALFGRPHHFFVETVTTVEITAVSAAKVQELVAGDPAFASDLMLLCADEETRICEQIELLKGLSALERLVAFILDRVPGEAGAAEVTLPCARQVLARLLGFCPETFSRALGKLRGHGVVSRPRSFVVADVTALARAYAHLGNRATAAVRPPLLDAAVDRARRPH